MWQCIHSVVSVQDLTDKWSETAFYIDGFVTSDNTRVKLSLPIISLCPFRSFFVLLAAYAQHYKTPCWSIGQWSVIRLSVTE